jgi:ubiquinone/menaquinone biosynthesis C-methylase UbiE
LIEVMRRLPLKTLVSNPMLLDIGASSGYYGEILRHLLGFRIRYRACDFSDQYRALAMELYPDIHFDVEDACSLSYHDDSFDIVLHSACIMHIYDYYQAIREAARVANDYVIFHRTPVHQTRVPWTTTRFFSKKAYGVECLELEFDETELLELFNHYGLNLIHQATIFTNSDGSMHRTYLLGKPKHERHITV